jgi:hypothetical protein
MKIAMSWYFDPLEKQEWSTPLGLHNSFKSSGCSIDKYHFHPQRCDLSELRSKADDYDLIFFCMAGPSESFDNELKLLKASTKTKIFMEFGDDIPQHITGSNFFKTRKYYVDGIFTLDLRCHNSYLEEGLPSHWMPVWCDDSIFYKQDVARDNVCVTTCLGQRPLLDEFKNRFGDKFKHKKVFGDNNSNFYNSGTFTYQFARYDELTRRIFEAGGCGNAVITNRISKDTGIYNLFIEDEDICYFSTADEAYEKMIKLYGDDEYRNKLSTNIYNKILNNHLVGHRAKQVLHIAKNT